VSVKPLKLRRFARNAGAVLLGIVALDLVATLLTVAVGATVLRR
jgi:hypothetical protein